MKNEQNDAPVTAKILKETLGEFTEEVILPAMHKIVRTEVDESIDSAFGKFRTEIKDHVDRKVDGLRGDLIAVMRGEHERDRTFKSKVIDIFKRNKLAKDDELTYLSELAR